MIRTIRLLERPDPALERVAKANGCSLHAGVSCKARVSGHQKDKRERPGGVPLCRYIARPAVAVLRLSLNSTGKVLYTLKARGSRPLTGMGRHRWHSTGAAIRRGFHRTPGSFSPARSGPNPGSTFQAQHRESFFSKLLLTVLSFDCSWRRYLYFGELAGRVPPDLQTVRAIRARHEQLPPGSLATTGSLL